MIIPLTVVLLATSASAQLRPASISQQAEIEYLMERANAAVNSGAAGLAKERKEELERIMGVRNDAGLIRIPTEADLKKLRGFFSDKRGDYAEATRIFSQAQAQSHSLYDLALEKTGEYYGVRPPKYSGTVTNGPPHDRGKVIIWAPHYGEPRLVSKPGEPFKFESAEDIDGQPSIIDPNGLPIFRISAFKNDAGQFDAGKLASYLRHEQIHHNLFLTDPSSVKLRNTPGVERALLLTVMREQSTFQLDQSDWTKLFYDASGWSYLEDQWQQRMHQGYDPYNPTDMAQQFNSINIPDARKDEIRRAADKDMALFTQLDGLIDSGQSVTALERVRAEGASDYLRDLNDGSILELIRGWKNARERETDKAHIKQELAFEKLLQALRHEADLCGFIAKDMHNSRWRYGFQDKHPIYAGGPQNDYYYTAPTGLHSAKAAFLLTRACYDGMLDTPCNDAIPEMQLHWSESDFRESLVLDGSGSMLQNSCVLHLRDSLTPPFGAKDIAKAARRYKKELSKEERRRSEEHWEREWAEARRRRREESGGSPPPGGRDPGWRQPCPNLECVPAVPW